MTDRNNFLGVSSFTWWVGEIESIVDPVGLNRCQVRIFGWHIQNKSQLSTKDLPWALPMYSVNTADMSRQTLNVGDWVVGFFMDSESGQMPIMMGFLPGLKQGK